MKSKNQNVEEKQKTVFSLLRQQHVREHGDAVRVPDHVGVAEGQDDRQAEDHESLFILFYSFLKREREEKRESELFSLLF